MDLRQRLLRPDLVALGGALLVLIALAAVDVTPFTAFVIAVAVYVGLVWARGRSGSPGGSTAGDMAERSEVAQEASRQKIANMRELAASIDRESTHEIVLRICTHADQVLAIAAEHSIQGIAPLFLEQLLEPAEALVETYVRLSSRGLKATDEMLSRYESQDFPMIERAARNFLEKMRSGSTVDLAALSQVLEFNLENTTPVTPRSPTR